MVAGYRSQTDERNIEGSGDDVAPAVGDTVAGRYVVEELLRTTRHAHVLKAREMSTDDPVVVKVLRGTADEARGFAREVDALTIVRSPRVVRLREWVTAPPVIAMDYIPGLTLRNDLREVRRYDASDVQALARDMCAALGAVHAAGYVHADVKPANIIVSGGAVTARTFTLIDFHLARAPGPVSSGIGTRLFRAPEQVTGGELTSAADVWGLGVCMYRAATGTLPFTGKDGHPQTEGRAAAADSHTTRGLPPEMTDLIDAMLDPDAGARPTLDDVVAALA